MWRPPGFRAADSVENALKHLQQKCAGSAGEIQHGDALMVGKAVADAETVFENVIHRAHDEIYHRRRCVIDAPAFARLLVIGLQIIFVEINERITLEQTMLFLVACPQLAADRLAAPERQVLVDGGQVQRVNDGQHFLDHPAHVAIFDFLKLGQEVDQFADQLE